MEGKWRGEEVSWIGEVTYIFRPDIFGLVFVHFPGEQLLSRILCDGLRHGE